MIDVAVLNKEGKEVESLKVDPEQLGGKVRYPLLKQAIVMYHCNKRLGTASTKSRGMVDGSTRKIYRQKGTGRARMGTIRSCIRTGGGVAFAKVRRDFGKSMPKKQRLLAKKSALLAKLESNDMVVIDELSFDKPKTKDFAKILSNLEIDRSCLVTTSSYDRNVYLSARNVPKTQTAAAADLNAGDICNKRKMLVTKEAFLELVGNNNG
jgi:large subunit ribosomal protein L4